MTLFSGRILVAVFAAVLAMSGADAAPADVAPVEVFFQNASFADASLSPDGRQVAAKVAAKGGRVKLAVINLENLTPKIVAEFTDADIGRVRWVNNGRLVFDLVDRHLAVGEQRLGPGLFAVNADGTGMKVLVMRSTVVTDKATLRDLLPAWTRLLDVPRYEESDDIYVIQPELNANRNELVANNLLRLNTLTGRAVTISRPCNALGWLIDPAGTPRIAQCVDQGRRQVHYLDPASGQWQKLLEDDAVDQKAWVPYAFGPDGSLYVWNKSAGAVGEGALYRFDLKTRQLAAEPALSTPGYDFTGYLLASRGALVGVRYETDAEGTAWFAESWKKTQQAVDALLPATINRLTGPLRGESPYVLVVSHADVQPPVTRLYHTGTGKLTLLGQAQPQVDAGRMATTDLVRYKARDGLEIPAYLTLPKNGARKNLPLVVLIHGGPYVRGGHWQWNGEVQFLASRGYAVLQPEFRGSTGYGDRLFRAGWKQWGLAMQDDIADGTRWAIAQGIADPKRICLAGASYGGYATLMGLARDGELYRCGINWVGVTDINLMYSVHWSDFSDHWVRFGMPVMVGDPVKDAAQLKATSPIQNAARIKQPLLMAYGGADVRVPIIHGTKFRDAVRDHNAQVEWVVYPDEGHGWGLVGTRIDFWTRAEKFLEKHIGR